MLGKDDTKFLNLVGLVSDVPGVCGILVQMVQWRNWKTVAKGKEVGGIFPPTHYKQCSSQLLHGSEMRAANRLRG